MKVKNMYNSRRKLNPINKRLRLNESELLSCSGKREEFDRNNYSNINNFPNNNEEKTKKFESKRQHLLQNI